MNDKFWALKTDKQNRIINGALKIFTTSNYRHASTDEIVAEAGISKGLLFHYFISKAGLYRFLIEYSARYMLLEMTSGLKSQTYDFYELCRALTGLDASVMEQYPCMPLFLENTRKESRGAAFAEEFPDATALLEQVHAHREGLFARSTLPATASKEDTQLLRRMLGSVRSESMTGLLAAENPDPSQYVHDMEQYISMLQRHFQ